MDAEDYQPKPQDVLRLKNARMLVRVGLDYDLWVDRLLAQAGKPRASAAAAPAMSMRLSPSPCWSCAG